MAACTARNTAIRRGPDVIFVKRQMSLATRVAASMTSFFSITGIS